MAYDFHKPQLIGLARAKSNKQAVLVKKGTGTSR